MLFRKSCPFLFSLLTLIFISCAAIMGAAQGSRVPTPSRIVMPVDNSVRVKIGHSTHPLAQSAYDIGPIADSVALKRMILVLRSSPNQEHDARTLLDSQQVKASPDYHHWLTPAEFGARFGPSPQEIQQVTAWLQQQGFSVDTVAQSGRWIEFSGTAGLVRSAFGTEMRQYMVAGQTHVANASDISIPAALAPVVAGVLSLHNFYSKPTHKRYARDANVPFGAEIHAIAPSDFAKIYDLNALHTASPTPLDGTGQTIAIIASSNINQLGTTGIDDIAIFRSVFGLPAKAPNIILNGPDPGVDTVFGAGAEATLDVQWAGAVAPNATIDLVVTVGSLTTDPIALGSAFVVEQNLASVMNLSFSACESLLGTENVFWNSVWEEAAAQGISVFVSSGDTGAAECDNAGESLTGAQGGVAINGIGSTPFNTSVGGTEFNETVGGGLDSTFWDETPNELSSAKGYIPEMVWNDSCSPTQAGTICPQLPQAFGQFLLLGTGGGLSTLYARPSYQTLSIPGLSVLGSVRGIPDVSLAAAVQHDPFITCFTTDLVNLGPDCQLSGGQITANTFQNLAGGTSFASPSFAGLMAIVDQKMGGRQGLANFVLYQLAAAENFSNCNSNSRTNPATPTTCVFNDTTVGNNGMPGNDVTNNPSAGALGFPATTGFDLSTGLGSVDGNNLVNAWATLAGAFPATITSISTSQGASVNLTHGQTITLSAQVQKNPSGAGPTGLVSFITDESAPQGGTFAVGSGVLSSGSFSGPFNNLPGGSYNLHAHYAGDGAFAASDSTGIPVNVAKEGSTTTLRSFILNDVAGTFSTGTTVAYGDTVNLLFMDSDEAGASSGLTPTSGTVTFQVGGTTFPAIAIDNSGIGEFVDCIFPQVACLTPGQYVVSATYSGDGISYNGSSSTSSITITVTKGGPIVSVGGPASVTAGLPFTISATVLSPGAAFFGPGSVQTPTGTVQFMDGTTALGSPVTLSGGSASAQVTLTSSGTHNLSAQYSGDANYNSGIALAIVVTASSPFTFTAAAPSQTIAAGGTATYNVTLNGLGGFTGQVSFNCAGAPGGSTCTVSPNPASLSASTTSVALMVTVTNTANARLGPSPLRTLPYVFAGVMAVMFAGLRRRPRQRLFLLLGIFLMGGVVSCGGGGGGGGVVMRPNTVATLTVTGTSGSITNTVNLTLTITH